MRKFDYSFLNNGLLPANLVNLTANISSLKTMAGVRKDEYKQIFTELEAVAKVQSIKSSNAIEGIVTSDERIAAIVNQNSAPLNHNEAEIAGYRDALNEIHLGFEHIDFRNRDILRLHEVMMSFAGYEYGGQYKTDDNVILEIDSDGNRRVRFRPTPAAETPKAMEQLELAYMEARSDANVNQLLLIPCIILDFLCVPIRPMAVRMFSLHFFCALSAMCDFSTHFPLLGRSFSLKPRKSEYPFFRLTILDFSGLISSPSRSFSHIVAAANIFTASLRHLQNSLKSSAYRTIKISFMRLVLRRF